MNKKLCIVLGILMSVSVCYGQRSELVSPSFYVKLVDMQELLTKWKAANKAKEDSLQKDMELRWQRDLEKIYANREEASQSPIRLDVKPDIETYLAEDGSDEINYSVSVSYETMRADDMVRANFSNNTDDYPLGAYNISQSNACSFICEFMKDKIETELSKYFIEGNQVTIKITGTTDGSAIRSKIPYHGEYGDFNEELIYLNGSYDEVSISEETGITTNAQLAFLRAQGVKQYLQENVDVLKNQNTDYHIYAVENEGKGAEYRRISIEIIIHGAFDKEIQDYYGITSNEDNISEITPDVDRNIPTNSFSNTDCFALIFANQEYTEPVPNAPFAKNDGKIFREYCLKTLGIPEKQVKIYYDATWDDIEDGLDWLTGVMRSWNGKAKVLVYYAGNGIKNEATEEAYIIPVKANPNNINRLLSLNSIYDKLASVESVSVTCFFDACFDGSQRNGQMLEDGLKPKDGNKVLDDGSSFVKRKPKESSLNGNIVVFSATDFIQTAYPLARQKHGMFTYYLLKNLQNTEGDITYKELFENIKTSVSQEASLDNHSQTPTMKISSDMQYRWENLRFNN